MKLSVIVPVYQVENTLRRCVESILSQGLSEWELILVDDGSTDRSAEICDELSSANSSIRVIHQPNAGLSAARNAGLDVSQGEIITFVDSDDFLLPEILPKVLRTMEERPDIDIAEYSVHTDCRHAGKRELTLEERLYSDPREYWLNSRAYEHAYAWNKLFRREAIGTERFPVGLVFEDVWFLPKILRHNPRILTLPLVGYYYTWNPEGITAKPAQWKSKQLVEAQLEAIKTLGIGFPSHTGTAIRHKPTARLYFAILNQQITAFVSGATETPLPFHRLPLSTANSLAGWIKILVLNIFGMKFLLKAMKRFL